MNLYFCKSDKISDGGLAVDTDTGVVKFYFKKQWFVISGSADVVTMSGTTGNIPVAKSGTVYKFETITALTVSAWENTGNESIIIFKTGNNAFNPVWPNGTLWQNGTAPTLEANTTYCVSCKFGLVTCGKFKTA